MLSDSSCGFDLFLFFQVTDHLTEQTEKCIPFLSVLQRLARLDPDAVGRKISKNGTRAAIYRQTAQLFSASAILH